MKRRSLFFNAGLGLLATSCSSKAQLCNLLDINTNCSAGSVCNLDNFCDAGGTKNYRVTSLAGRLTVPYGITTHTDGTLYIAESGGRRIRFIDSKTSFLHTIAGSGTEGFVDGEALDASFGQPNGIAVDNDKNIYVADYTNHAIRKITPAGVVSTFAGNGTVGNADGTGTAAGFNQPTDILFDPNTETLFVSDKLNHAIRQITLAGVVTTVAGGTQGFADGTGTAAQFDILGDIALDSETGTLYIADQGNYRVRQMVVSTKAVTTIAGNGTASSVDGNGASASFHSPHGIAFNQGILYVSELNGHTIRAVNIATTAVSTIAGTGTSGDAEGASAQFFIPAGLTVKNGILYVCDSFNSKIKAIDLGTNITSTAMGKAGTGTSDGPNSDAASVFPFGITVDANHKITFLDVLLGQEKLDEIDPTTYSVTNVVSMVSSEFAFGGVGFLTLDDSGNIFATAYQSSQILKIDTANNVTVFAGSGTAGLTDGTGTAAQFNQPTGIAYESTTGNLYVADLGNNKLRKITSAGVVTTLADITLPGGVAVDAAGQIYVSGPGTAVIYRVSPEGKVEVFAGQEGVQDFKDGVGTDALFGQVVGISIDAYGYLIAVDDGARRVRKINLRTREVITIAGNGNPSAGPGQQIDGPGLYATFGSDSLPITGVAIGEDGRIYIGDAGSLTVRILVPVT